MLLIILLTEDPGQESHGTQERRKVQRVMHYGNAHREFEPRPVVAGPTAAEPNPIIIPARGGPSLTG
jgi:hypothetical protein